MIFSGLYSKLEKKQLFNDNQMGFRPNSSTAFAISSLYDKLIKNVNNGSGVRSGHASHALHDQIFKNCMRSFAR